MDGVEPLHPRERFQIRPPRPIIPTMPCVIKLIMDLILGPEEKIAYVSVTTR
jgi:hypothetical protein